VLQISEIKKEKLGFLEKLLGTIGKRYMWWRAKKANKLLVHLGFVYTIYELYKLTDSFDKAADIMKQVGLEAGKDIVYESLELAKPVLSRSIADLEVILKSSWYAFLGKQKINYFEYVPPDSEGVEKIIWRCNNCMLCSEIDSDPILKDILDNTEEKVSFGSVMCGIFESFFNTVMEYAGRNFEIKVEETKCMGRGDDYQELRAIFTPKKVDE
jgi:hypothetical protein